jgi:hypothetical protein
MPSAAPIPAAAPAATTARRLGAKVFEGRAEEVSEGRAADMAEGMAVDVAEGMAEGCKALLLEAAFGVPPACGA